MKFKNAHTNFGATKCLQKKIMNGKSHAMKRNNKVRTHNVSKSDKTDEYP